MSSDRSVIDFEGVPDAAEWRQLDALAIRARLPLEALRDGIEPFPTFIEMHRRRAGGPAGRHHYSQRAYSLRRALHAASRAGAASSIGAEARIQPEGSAR
jgi:hypothetical protein